MLRVADHEGDNKILLDWEALSAECPGECFYADGIHLDLDSTIYGEIAFVPFDWLP